MSSAISHPHPCMHDHHGRPVAQWLPEMQSSEFLRASIARGERTAECWSVLKANRERVRAGLIALGKDPDHRRDRQAS
jgi:hypothetical protein